MKTVDGLPVYSENELADFHLKRRSLEETVMSECIPDPNSKGSSWLTINVNFYNWEITRHMQGFMRAINNGSFHSAALNLNRSIQNNIAYVYIKHCEIK